MTVLFEGPEGAPLLRTAEDAPLLVEACLNLRARAALLYASNLPSDFFDLSSGAAGAILQKIRQYRIRLAVVAPSSAFSTHFAEMAHEEQRKGYFAVFASAAEGRAWITRLAASASTAV